MNKRIKQAEKFLSNANLTQVHVSLTGDGQMTVQQPVEMAGGTRNIMLVVAPLPNCKYAAYSVSGIYEDTASHEYCRLDQLVKTIKKMLARHSPECWLLPERLSQSLLAVVPKRKQPAPRNRQKRPLPKSLKPCRYWLRVSGCRNGKKCPCDHSTSMPHPRERRSRKICRYTFLVGGCQRTQCPDLHDLPARMKQKCHFAFKLGICNKGVKCKFKHPNNAK